MQELSRTNHIETFVLINGAKAIGYAAKEAAKKIAESTKRSADVYDKYPHVRPIDF